MGVAPELLAPEVEAVEHPGLAGDDPQRPPAVLVETDDEVVGQGVGVLRVVFEDLDAIAVEAVEAVLCADPQEAPAVLEEDVARALGQALGDRQPVEFDPVALGLGRGARGK